MATEYLFDVLVMLIGAVLVVPCFQRLKLGAVPGFLVVGVIVGPSGLGLIQKISEIAHFADIGVVLLLFVIGIELKPSRLLTMRKLVFGLGLLQVLLTGLILGGLIHLGVGMDLPAAILIGPALALSSTAFVLQLLAEQKSLATTYGRISFSVLLMQDLAVVPLLALLPLLAQPDMTIGPEVGWVLFKSLAVLLLIVMVGRHLLHPVLHRVAMTDNAELFTASALLIVLGTAVVMEHIGFSMSMGAFLAGLLISDSSYKHQIMAEIQPFRGLLLGMFFMSMGMSLNLAILIENFGEILQGLIVLILIKIMVLFPLVYLFGFKLKNCFAVALILAQSGEFALVLFSLALRADLIAAEQYQNLLIIVLLSMLITPLLGYFSYRLSQIRSTKKGLPIEPPEDAPVLLAGFGRVGQRIGEILTLSGCAFVGLDSDAETVESARKAGHPVYFGDVRNPKVLKSIGAGHAQMIIVTVNDPETTKKVVSSLRSAHPGVKIFVRGHSLSHCCDLRRLGATGAVSEYVEISLELARMVLLNTGANEKTSEAILNDFRQTYYAEINRAEYSEIASKKE